MPMRKVTLGEVAREHKEVCREDRSSYPIVGLEHLTPEDVNLTAWSEDAENTFTKMFRKGNVLFGRRRAYLRKAAQAPFDGICSGDITVIEAIPGKIEPELLPFVIQNDQLFDFAVEKSAGSLSPRVKWEHLKNYTFNLPELAEQKKLADLLWAMDAAKQAYQRLLQKTDELVKSRFSEMFGRMPRNEKHWTVVTIRDVVTEVRYGSSRPAVENGQYPYLRMNNITYSGELDLSEIKRIDVPDNELSKCTVRRGDVLFNRTNSKELVGKTCVYNRDEMMVLAGFVIRVRLDHEKMLPEFLSAFLNTDFSKQMLLNMCKTAIGQANINAQELQNISVFLPPLQLQKDFVAIKQQLDKSKVICNKIHKMVEFSQFRV